MRSPYLKQHQMLNKKYRTGGLKAVGRFVRRVNKHGENEISIVK